MARGLIEAPTISGSNTLQAEGGIAVQVEDKIDKTMTQYWLTLAHKKHVKSIDLWEWLNQEIKSSREWKEGGNSKDRGEW